MNNFISKIIKLNQLIDKVCLTASIVFMVLMITCVCIQIVARYGFDAPPAWTEELARYAMIYSALLGACCAYYRRQDPVLFNRLKNAKADKKLILQCLETATVCLFFTPILYYSPATLLRHFERETETLGISSAYVLGVVPLCFSIIVLFSLTRVLAELQPLGKPSHSPRLSNEH